MGVEIVYEGQTVVVQRGQSVLESLEEGGIDVPSSCRAGACQCCLLQATDGVIPQHAQRGLKESLKRSGHFLACLCRPETPLVCRPGLKDGFQGQVTIAEITEIGPDTWRIRFHKPEGLNFAPGQFVSLSRADGVTRSYSIATGRSDLDYFDIHVRHVPNGKMSSWLCKTAKRDDSLWLEGPKGDCTYLSAQPDEPLLLVGTGTGIAPLAAVAEDAMIRNHSGPIRICQGAPTENRLYYVDELSTLASLAPNIDYIRCLLQGASAHRVHIGDLGAYVLASCKELMNPRIYLCGDPGLVQTLKKKLFLAGVSLARIHADPFIGSDSMST